MTTPSNAGDIHTKPQALLVSDEDESEEWDLIPKGMVFSPVPSDGTPIGSPTKSFSPKMSRKGQIQAEDTTSSIDISRDSNDLIGALHSPQHNEEAHLPATDGASSLVSHQSASVAHPSSKSKKSARTVRFFC